MTEHRFGGNWTEVKLGCLCEYLQQYRQIFTRNERARYYRTWYVDAFAGTGSRVDPGGDSGPTLFDDVYTDEDSARYREGSPKIALNLPEPFDYYFFVEKSRNRLTELKESLRGEFPERIERCSFQQGDANDVLTAWCKERDWARERAVVFLDPYGMQVDWSTVEAIAATKGIDLWYLFPLGVGVMRLLPHSGEIEEAWRERLDRVLGTGEWRDAFFRVNPQGDLPFLDEPRDALERTVTPASIKAFIQERLATKFAGVADGLLLENSRSSPLYLLCFAAGNVKGAEPAVRIAQHILARGSLRRRR